MRSRKRHKQTRRRAWAYTLTQALVVFAIILSALSMFLPAVRVQVAATRRAEALENRRLQSAERRKGDEVAYQTTSVWSLGPGRVSSPIAVTNE